MKLQYYLIYKYWLWNYESYFNWKIYVVIISLIFQNNLGILWSEREEIGTAQAYLESSEALYNQYMKEVCCILGTF